MIRLLIKALMIGACAAAQADPLRIVTYNIHGGVGPNGEGDLVSNLTTFRDSVMKGEDILCLQEVPLGTEWDAVRAVFSDYPHTFFTVNSTTAFIWPWQTRKRNAIAILSKHPFTDTDSRLIQIDPAVDRWERHAQHVQITIDGEAVHIFHIHNTYNFNNNDFEWERSGMEKFRDYVFDRLGIGGFAEAGNLIMLGDYNLFEGHAMQILPTPDHYNNHRDHISTVPLMESKGWYPTYWPLLLSDHNAVWAEIDLTSPSPNPSEWATEPAAAASAPDITMSAVPAVDAAGVEYYFANTSVPDGSRDSGWQDNPAYTDSGVEPLREYSYRFKTRDKSRNRNESGWSRPVGASIPVPPGARYRMGDGGHGASNLPLDSGPGGLHFIHAIGSATITPNGGGFDDDAYYSFNGIDQAYYDIGYDLPEDNIGIELWVRTSDLAQNNRNVFGNGSNLDGIHIGFDAASGGWFGAVANVAFVGATGAGDYAAGEWIHLALVRDNGTSTFYVNGAPRGSSTAVPNNATVVHMAVNAGGSPGNYFGGDIAEARILFFAPGEFDPDTDLLLKPEVPAGYAAWAAGFPGVSDTAPNRDSDGDSLPDGIEYVVGGNPTVNDSEIFAPVPDFTSEPGHMVFRYRFSHRAKADPDVSAEVLYSPDLITWTAAEHDPEGTGITVSTTPMTGYDLVAVSIPLTLASDTRLFTRLRAVFENNPE